MSLKNYTLGTAQQLIILLIVAFGLNINTLFNGYVLDDVVVMTENSFVQNGIKGIPDILTKEYFYGLVKKESDLSGGRYRPIALVVFALEHQFFGANPFVSHLINVLLFVLLVSLLFRLLNQYVFRDQHKYLAFFTCLLFVVHPIHTEVIANVKSRDEIITFLFLIASSFAFIKYSESRSKLHLFSGLFCFLLALLTRESAIPFIGIVPLISYFFFNQSIKKSLLYTIPLVAVFIVYLILRISVVGFAHARDLNVMNYPFIYATPSQAFATKVFILFKYFWLLVFPHPLSFDYGYNEIPYIEINSIRFIFSSIFLIGLIAIALTTFNKRSIFSFSILFFLITILLFSNILIDIGAPLAERLLFQPSLAFCILIATVYLKSAEKLNVISNSILIIVLVLFSAKTIQRNFDWKDNFTLFSTDVKTCPNSVRTNLFTAQQYLMMAGSETDKKLKSDYYNKAIYHDERIQKIAPHYRYIYEGLGFAYFGLNNYLKAADHWLQTYKLDYTNREAKKRVDMLSDILYNEGNRNYRIGNIDSAITFYKKSVELNEKNVDAWYNLGGNYFLKNDTKNGIEAWENVMRLAPDHKFDRDKFSLQ